MGLTEAAKAREILNDAEKNLNVAQKHLEEVKEELLDLFDPTGYGAEGGWKKLHNTCLKKDTGEYVLSIKMNIPVSHHVCSYEYEVCLFKEAKQQAKNGGSSFSLGCGSSD
jgi:protein kinase C substrate 80K-H